MEKPEAPESPDSAAAIRKLLRRTDDVANLTKISQFIEAFESKLPLDKLAAEMAALIKAPKISPRDKMLCINFFLNAKRFQEKHQPKLDDEEIENMTMRQIDALIEHQFGIALGEPINPSEIEKSSVVAPDIRPFLVPD